MIGVAGARPSPLHRAAVMTLGLALLQSARADVTPQDTYVGTATVLGVVGGTALGLSLGGLSRPESGSRVTPFLRWGSVGAVFGGVLGHAIGASAVEATPEEPGLTSRPTREATACAGTLIGELVGFGIGAVLGRPVARNSREVWAAIPLGGVVGAAAGWLMKPPAFLAAPPRQARRDMALAGEMNRMEPLVAVGPQAAAVLAEAEEGRVRPDPARPAGDQPRLDALRNSLLRPEAERLLPGSPDRLRIAPTPDILPSLEPPATLVTLARSLLSLALLEGAALGAAGGASLSGGDTGFYERLGIGGLIGALAGWSASASLTSAWTEPSVNARVDFSDAIDQAHHGSGVLVGGLVGTVVGAAAGAVLHNLTAGVDRTDIARSALVGNAAGLLAGFIFSASRAPRSP